MASISNLVLSMPPSDFIWVTTAEQMLAQTFRKDMGSRRQRDTQEESILGSEMACQAPSFLPKIDALPQPFPILPAYSGAIRPPIPR